MKQKIITALKTKYQRFGLSNEAVDRIASAKEKTVKDESEIESAIADAETMELIANELQKSADKARRESSDLQKSFNEYKEKHPETDPNHGPDPSKGDEDEPAWAKKLREQNEAIAARFKAEDDAKRLGAARSAVEAKLKAAGCSNPGILALTLKGFALGEKETEDEAVTRLKSEYDASYKETFGDGAIPGTGAPAFGDAKTAIQHKNAFLRSAGLLPSEEKK